jgi:primosomal protein N'
MYIAHVIPISKGMAPEVLSYFTATNMAPGTLVSIPLRSQKKDAIVLSCEEALSMKSTLRNAPFHLKKIIDVKNTGLFLPAFLASAKDVALFAGTSTGTALKALVPEKIFQYANVLPRQPEPKKPKEEPKEFSPHVTLEETYVIQAEDAERLATYKSIIRESFAREESVFFCVPDKEHLAYIMEHLQKGISEYTFALHGDIPYRKLILLWKQILSKRHPVLLIGTGMFFSIPRADIKTIIVDREGSDHYKMLFRPFLDTRTFVKCFAKRQNAKLIFGDLFLRPETIWKQKAGEYTELSSLQFRSLSSVTSRIIDMAPRDKSTPFSVIKSELKEHLRSALEKNGRIFLFAARRGLHTSTVCSDCGKVVACHTCGLPLVLHTKNTVRVFLCHKCGHEAKAIDQCSKCFSWRLVPLGVGTESVVSALESLFPKQKIFRIDKDATTKTKAKATAEHFYNTPGSILVGTELALTHLREPIEHTCVVSADALFSIPDFRINEKIFRLLLRIRGKATETFFIQTRRAENPIWAQSAKGDLLSFYQKEITERKTLGYPPFSLFIKISYSGKQAEATAALSTVEEVFSAYNPIIFPAFIPHVRGAYTMHAVIKIPPKSWPDKKLSDMLSSLPLSFTINIDPEHLL